MLQPHTALWAIFLNLMFHGQSPPNFLSLIEHSGFSLQKEWYVASIVFSRILKFLRNFVAVKKNLWLFQLKLGPILLLLCLIFAWKGMSSIDCSETALSNKGDVWRFLILRVVRGVLDLAILEATICLVAFDVFISFVFQAWKN